MWQFYILKMNKQLTLDIILEGTHKGDNIMNMLNILLINHTHLSPMVCK